MERAGSRVYWYWILGPKKNHYEFIRYIWECVWNWKVLQICSQCVQNWCQSYVSITHRKWLPLSQPKKQSKIHNIPKECKSFLMNTCVFFPFKSNKFFFWFHLSVVCLSSTGLPLFKTFCYAEEENKKIIVSFICKIDRKNPFVVIDWFTVTSCKRKSVTGNYWELFWYLIQNTACATNKACGFQYVNTWPQTWTGVGLLAGRALSKVCERFHVNIVHFIWDVYVLH